MSAETWRTMRRREPDVRNNAGNLTGRSRCEHQRLPTPLDFRPPRFSATSEPKADPKGGAEVSALPVGDREWRGVN
jgi:hypothetical protein